MAKKTDEFELDDFKFDDGLDAPDFDFEPTPVKDDRSPAKKVATSFAQGAKDTVLSGTFARRMIKDTLPRGYGSGLDLADQTATTLQQLYNTAAKEIKPVVKDVKRATGRIVTMADSVLPKKIADKLREWAKDDDKKSSQLSAEQQRDASVNMQLAEIFKLQSENDSQNRAEDKAKDNIKQQMDQNRHLDNLGQLNQIRLGVSRLAQYQDKITINYQRKSLELQLRHYFVAMDSLEEQKKQNAVVTSNLEAITKNTALPEFVKLTNHERFTEMLRNKFMSGIQDNLFDLRRGFMRNLGQNLVKNTKAKAGQFAQQVREGMGMFESLAELQEMQREMGIEPDSVGQMAGNMAGGAVADTFGRKIGSWLGKPLRKSEKVRRIGNNTQFFADNLAQIGWDFAKSDKYDDLPLVGGLIRMFKDSMGPSGVDYSLGTDNLKDLQGPGMFTNQARKSITEVIPGYLARIFRELQIMRTGDGSIELTNYDFDSNKFSGTKALAQKTFNKLFNGSDVNDGLVQANDLVSRIDPNNRLSPEARSALARQLIKNNLNNVLADPSKMSDPDMWWRGETGRYGDDISDAFKSYFRDDKDSSKKVAFSKDYNALGKRVGDPRELIQSMINLGQYDILRELGVVDGNGINKQRLEDFWTGERLDGTVNDGQEYGSKYEKRVKELQAKRKKDQRKQKESPTRSSGFVGGGPSVQNVQFSQGTADKLIETIKGESVKDETSLMRELLERIAKRLDDVVNVNVVNGFGPGPGGPGGAGGPGGGPNKPWYMWNIGDLGTGVGRLGKWGFDTVNSNMKRAWNTGNTVKNWGWSAAKSMWEKAGEKYDKFNEVWVKGEITPRLTLAKLRAEKYRDVLTGKIISSFEEITGPIRDEETGEIVLRPEDLKNAFMKSKVGEKLVSLWSKVSDKAKKLITGIQAPMVTAYNFAIDMGKKAWDKLDEPVDIYTKDGDQPVLLAIMMRGGNYTSRKTGDPITKPSQIDGVVMKGDEVALSEEDLRGGLFTMNRRGQKVPLKTGLSKLGAIGHEVLFGGWKHAGKAFNWAKDKMSKAWEQGWGFVKGLFGGFMGPEGIVFAGSRKMQTTLEEIRDILDGRLPGKKRKKVAGDADGDGIRDNSYEDIKRKRGDELKEKLAAAKEAGLEKSRDIYGKGMVGLTALLKKYQDKFGKDEEEGGDGDTNIYAGGGDGKEGEPKKKETWKERRERWKQERAARRANRPKGLWNKAKHYGGKALKGGGRLLGGAARIGSGLLMGEAAMGALGTLGAGAATVGSAALSGASALAGGAVTGIAGLGSMLVGGASAVAGLLTAPVVLGALAVAAVGVGAYYGYKYLTRKKLAPLSTVRYAQYGFLASETDYLQKVFGLEDMLKDKVAYKDGIAELDDSKLDYKEMVKSFDIDPSDYRATETFLRWFAIRFKPIYMTALTAVRKTNNQVDLADVDDKLNVVEKASYLDIAKWLDGPYDVSYNPFDVNKQLSAGTLEVRNAVDLAKAAIDKEKADNPEGTKKAEAAAAALAAMTPEQRAEAERKKVEADDAKKRAEVGPGGRGAQALKMARNFSLAQQEATKAGENERVLVVGQAMQQDRLSGSRMDALTCVRYKTYGLRELDIDKVRALDALELEVAKSLAYNGDDTATWMGSLKRMLPKFGPMFGVEGVANDRAYDWMTWFQVRFLPTFLNFATSVYRNTKKNDLASGLKSLTPAAFVDVAQVIYTTQSAGEKGVVSVWQQTASPWPYYVLNIDPRSTDVNVKALKEAAQKQTFDETVGKGDVKAEQRAAQIADQKFNKRFEADKGIDFSKNPSMLLSTVQAGRMQQAGSVAARWMYTSGGGGVAPYMTGSAFSGGVAVQHPGNGTGGDINSLPMPTGNGSWAAMKDLIIQASKMAGVDPQLMATMAAIESGFDYKVKAGTSSATGLYQFISDTWQTMLNKYGSKYGLAPNTPATDPRANALMGAEFIKENMQALQGTVQRPLTDTDLYLAHFLGARGARKFLGSDPNTVAAYILPDAARANDSIFYEGGRALTVREVYAKLNNLVRTKGAKFGVSIDPQTPAANDSSATAPSTTAASSTTPAVPPLLAASAAAPAAAAAIPSAPTAPIGVMPVANNPAAVSPALAAAPTPAPTQAPVSHEDTSKPIVAAAPLVPVAAAAASDGADAFSGFAPQARNLKEQQKYQEEVSTTNLSSIEGTLGKSYEESQKQTDLLRKILQAVSRGASNAPAAQQEQQSSSRQPRQTQDAPTAPVKMSRNH